MNVNLIYKINSYLKKFLPGKVYTNLRSKLLKLYRLRLKVFTEDEIRDLLINKLEVKKGSVVFVHSSINQIRLTFPFYKLISILKDIVGEEGTLLFPCWKNIDDWKLVTDNPFIFDVKRTPTDLGILPEFVRRQKDAYRSLSPVNSVVAIGNDSNYFINEHHLDIYPCGYKSPFYKLMQKDGIIIGIGVTARYLSFCHCIEDTHIDDFPMQTRSDETYSFKVKTSDDLIIEVKSKIPHINIRQRNVSKYLKKYISSDIAKNLVIHKTNFYSVKAKPMYDKMLELAKKNITIYNV